MELAEKNRREEGGWVYQNQRTGKLWSRLKKRDTQRDKGDGVLSINLGTPPKLKGWKVVGTFHTHPNDLGPSGEIEFLPNGMIKASGDHLANWSQGVPGLVLARSAANKGKKKGIKYWTYGPSRGYFGDGLPARCRKKIKKR